MEDAVWVASSDSEDATSEMDEEDWAPSNTGHQGSLGEVAAELTTGAQGCIGLSFNNKAAAPRKSCDSLYLVKAEAGEKPPHKDKQDLIHFGKKDGTKVLNSFGVYSTLTEEDDISHSESEEAQEQVTEQDLGETEEEVECHSSTSEIGVHQKQSPRSSEVQRKRRNLTADGQGQASKLVKRSEQPQKVQMPHTSTECGESASNPTPSQWSESFQARHLEGNRTAKKPINGAQSTESFSPSSQLVKRQEVPIGVVTYNCPKCKTTFKTSFHLNRDRSRVNHEDATYKCSECTMNSRRHARRNVKKLFKCLKCNTAFNSKLLLNRHVADAHEGPVRVPCLECNRVFSDPKAMQDHRNVVHGRHVAKAHEVRGRYPCLECDTFFYYPSALQSHQNVIHEKYPFRCIGCSLGFMSFLSLFNHHITAHQTGFKCLEYNMDFTREQIMNKQFNIDEIAKITEPISFADYMKGFAVDEALDFPWEVRK